MYDVGGGIIDKFEFLYKIQDFKDKIVVDNKNREYYNIPAAFDIEVTSFYENGEKRALMYIWQFGIYNLVVTGRTWKEFDLLMRMVSDVLHLGENRRLIIYVHNLPYEFQFIRKRFKWDRVFLLEERKPVYSISGGLEFRCSLKLSGGKSLENVGKDLQKYVCKKLVGNLDYNKVRTPLTPLTKKEMEYCEYDIRVLLCYIQEKIEQDGDITRIPLTNTGYVRNYCRKKCYQRWRNYRNIITSLTITKEEYEQLQEGFQGGFTHANAHYVRKILHNVGSHDLTSSYPSSMVLEEFPMSKANLVENELSEEELLPYLDKYCCLFDIEIWHLRPKLFHEHPLSESKCWFKEGYILSDNGRIAMAEHIFTTITEQDYFTFAEFYSWDILKVTNLRYYYKNYLPKPFVLSILDLYKKKTELKDVEGEEVNYMISKNMINAGYGMVVTNPLHDILDYVNETGVFTKELADAEEAIEKYNKNIRRFLYYPWGIWVTAYARANLFSGIAELKSDYVYSDTDSIKSLNTSKYLYYFDNYNKEIMDMINRASEYHRISSDLFMPENKKGKRKIIGVWEYEGEYELFKTLGAKRYLTFSHKKSHIELEDGSTVDYIEPVTTLTVAGANKNKGATYLRTTKQPFISFSETLEIPKEYSGRMILTYIDQETEGDIVDMNGVPYHYHELSSVHMEQSEYNLTLGKDFTDYLKGVIDGAE